MSKLYRTCGCYTRWKLNTPQWIVKTDNVQNYIGPSCLKLYFNQTLIMTERWYFTCFLVKVLRSSQMRAGGRQLMCLESLNANYLGKFSDERQPLYLNCSERGSWPCKGFLQNMKCEFLSTLSRISNTNRYSTLDLRELPMERRFHLGTDVIVWCKFTASTFSFLNRYTDSFRILLSGCAFHYISMLCQNNFESCRSIKECCFMHCQSPHSCLHVSCIEILLQQPEEERHEMVELPSNIQTRYHQLLPCRDK